MDRKYDNNFRGLDVPKDRLECKFFTVVSIDSLPVYDSKYYLQVYLGNCVYKVVHNQMRQGKIRSYKCCITTELI